MNNSIYLNNKDIVKRLVKNNFSLNKESLEMFNDFIDNPKQKKIPEYSKIYESKDLRHRVKISKTALKKFDSNWIDFKKFFLVFAENFQLLMIILLTIK